MRVPSKSIAVAFLCTALSYVAIAPAIAQEMTIRQYLTLSQGTDPYAGSPAVNSYLEGVLDSFGYMQAALEKKNQPRLYCEPANAALGPLNLRQLLDDEIRRGRAGMSDQQYAAFVDFNLSALSLLVLQRTYPCG